MRILLVFALMFLSTVGSAAEIQLRKIDFQGQPVWISVDGNTALVNVTENNRPSTTDCFLYTFASNTLELISMTPDGREMNREANCIGVFGNGRYVIYVARQDLKYQGHAPFVFDRTTKKATLIRLCPNGSLDNVGSPFAEVSDTGRLFAYYTDYCTGNIKGPNWFYTGVYLDLSGDTVVARHNFPAKVKSVSGVSRDGKRAIVRTSIAYKRNEIEAFDVERGTTRLVSDHVGNKLNADTTGYISDDGKFLIFESDSGLVVPSDYNNKYDVFKQSFDGEDTYLASATPQGKVGNSNSRVWGGHVNIADPTGRYIAFWSDATNLTNPTTKDMHCYLRDTQTNRTIVVDRNSEGVAGNAGCRPVYVRTNPLRVVFHSEASNLLPDTKGGAKFLATIVWP